MARLAEFTTVSQPIFNLNDGGIAGFEFLTRGPSGPLEMPNELFRLAESNHILTLVDLHCLKMSLSLCKSLPPGVIGHINLFPSTLNDLPVERLLNLFDGYTDLDLCIELSARQLLTDCERTKERTRALQKSGIAIGLDNVGFGCSSLETLTQLEPDIVKIDSRCVSHLSSDPAKQKSLSTLVNPPYALSLVVIFFGLFLLVRRFCNLPGKTKSKELLYISFIFAVLVQIKIYAGILILLALFIGGMWDFYKNRNLNIIKMFAVALILSILIYYYFL